MSLETLLEAARYLELQELKQQQQKLAERIGLQQQHQASQQAAVTPQIAPKPEIASVQTPPKPTAQQKILHNSFDIINPLVIDETGEQKRRQPPLVFRSGTREVHNKLEKHRRAHLKECFDLLKKQLPTQTEEKKTSNLSILHSALRHIQALKRKERELEHEMERLAREKISSQQRLALLKKEIVSQCDNVDFGTLLPDSLPPIGRMSPVQGVQEQIETHKNGTTEATALVTAAPRELVAAKPAQQQQAHHPVQATALSVLPVAAGYHPVGQSLVLHKVALVPKNITDLTATAVSSPVAHFIAAPQQLNGKVLPVMNAQYLVKPVVVVSSPPAMAPAQRPS